MPSFGFLKSKFFGNTASTAAGFAGGVAVAPALVPLVRAIENEAWKTHPDMPPDAYQLAQGVAQGQVDPAYAKARAAEQGIGGTAFDALVNIANTGPALGYAYEAWRRGFLTPGEFKTALTRQGIEPQWFDALEQLKTRLLDLPTLANLIQRGLVASPFPLPYNSQPGAGKIEAFPTVAVDVEATVAGLGYTLEDLKGEVGLAGNPPGPQALYRAQWRGAIDPNDVERGLVEGRSRGEWAPAFEADARAIPTIAEYVDNAIRGYSTLQDAQTGAAKHGMSPADALLVYQNAGRPLVPHQIRTALARGAKFNPEPGELPDPYQASARESNVKPSYEELYIANAPSYPSLFQLNALVKAGAITPDTAKDWAMKEGYADEVVAALYTFWQSEAGGTSTATAKPRQYTYSQIHAAWRHGIFTDQQALTELETLGYSTAKADTLLATWKQTPTTGSTA